jgi:16S rRNA (uracil1498-N3)-methyltransferase
MVPRIHVAGLVLAAGPLEVPADEAHHLQHVLRLRAGAAVRVFDGAGHEWEARVARVDRRGVAVELLNPVTPGPEWDVNVVLAQAVLKGERMDGVVRDATMLGVAAVWPMTTRHDAVGTRASDPRQGERWRRVAAASAKQCGRAVVPAIRDVTGIDDVLTARREQVGLLLVEPAALPAVPVGGRGDRSLEAVRDRARSAGAVVLVGPEGGWAGEEVERAIAAGCVPWTLGGLTLRADAIAVCALAVLRYAWGSTGTSPGPP